MARLLAEIINDFFDPLSYKSMGFLALILVSIIYFSMSGFFNKPTHTVVSNNGNSNTSVSNTKNAWQCKSLIKLKEYL